jgi:glycosyltransferase involved in cell wall biosynthesis
MLDPLGQSQVVPYVKELTKLGVQFTLLSFERESAYTAAGAQRIKHLNEELSPVGIRWHHLRYHQRPSIPATAYDVAAGVRFAARLVKRDQIELIHARSHIPAVMALRLKRRFGSRMIFDVRGLMADEYVDAGHWREGSLPYRLTKSAEARALNAADGIVTLTHKIWPLIKTWYPGVEQRAIHEVVPCCADLELFRFDENQRNARRRELGLVDKFVVVYSGSIDGWYLTEQMAEYFATVRAKEPAAHFLWLTPSRHERIKELMKAHNIAESSYTVVASQRRDVPSYLSAADVGLAFIKPCTSKLASSPTKYAEYLACGLPLTINANIGDSDALITEWDAGVLVNEFAQSDYLKALAGLDQFRSKPSETRLRMRAVAEKLFDLQTVGVARYADLYRRLFDGPPANG